ncbi:uncharacterized protein [Nicotiana tomentosiformis]|uniref:uncharacterized protein n=1 Tax=Nicotiana tomentosiformis TaxID=4098 RepID=UPI00388CA663
MLIALSAKNKLGVVTGRNPQPSPDSPYFFSWERCNDMLIAWTNSLTRDIFVSLIEYNTSKDIWRDLNEMFGQSNASFSTSAAPGSTNRFVSQKVQFDSKRQPSSVSCSTSHDFTKEQYQHLMSLLQNAHVAPAPVFLSPLRVLLVIKLLLPVLQAPSLKRPLEIGRVDKGLYFLTPDTSTTSPSCFVVNSVPMCDFSVSFVIHDSPYVHSVAPVSLVSSNIFVVPFVTRCVPCNPLSVDNKIDVFCHQRLGHMPFHKMKFIPSLSDKLPSKQAFLCSLVHFDIWGPYHTRTYNGFMYFLTLVDDYSRVTWTHLLSCKSNALSVLKAFVSMVESNLPLKYWGDCVLTATYLINRLPSTVLHNFSPFEKLHGHSPSLGHLRSFGDIIFYEHVFPYQPSAFNPSSSPFVDISPPSATSQPVCLYILVLFDSTNVPFVGGAASLNGCR